MRYPRILSNPSFLGCLLALMFRLPLGLADDYVLPPIIKDASPVDSLAQDPVVPSQENQTTLSSGSGTLIQNLVNQLPYSVTDPGRPGSLTQFRGVGRSAEDTNVQSLGIPLNPPQGGGFDFSTLPQFLWTEYQLTLTPSLSALDPRAASGTISLVPWTAAALSAPETGLRNRWSALYAGSDLQQVSVATSDPGHLAVLVGDSSGLLNGPSGSMSARLAGTPGSWTLNAHLLASDIDAKTFNFGFGQSPEQTTTRITPVLQLDATPSDTVDIRSSAFYDNEYIRYDDASGDYFSRDRARQFGIENAILTGAWKFGLGSRQVNYQITGFNAPAENVTNLLASPTFSWETGSGSTFLLNPVAQGVFVTGFDFAPQASLGAREQWESGWGAYARASYSRLFPALADLYYSVPAVGSGNAILANPALDPEDDFTYMIGADDRSGIWEGSLQAYYQVRDNAQVLVLSAPSTDQQQNVGRAWLASLVASSSLQLMKAVRISDSAHFTDSQVEELQSPYPYMPDFLNILGVELDPVPRLTLSADTRLASSQFVDSSATLPATAFTDIQATYAFESGLQLIGRIENITGDDLVLEQDYPPKDRVFIISAVGSF